MTDDIKKLIAAAYAWREPYSVGSLIRRLADALEEAEAEILRQRGVDRRAELQYQGLKAERDALEANRAAWIGDAFDLVRKAKAERDAIRTAAQMAHIQVRGALEKLDSYSWHANDSGFVTSTRLSAIAAFEALSRAIDTKEKADD